MKKLVITVGLLLSGLTAHADSANLESVNSYDCRAELVTLGNHGYASYETVNLLASDAKSAVAMAVDYLKPVDPTQVLGIKTVAGKKTIAVRSSDGERFLLVNKLECVQR